MNKKFGIFYIGWIVITLFSFSALEFFPIDSLFSKILQSVGVSGILVIFIQSIIQFWRDRLIYERERALQNSQHDFTIGIASKMAEIAFEKHFKFCEEYIEIAYKALLGIGTTDAAVIDQNGRLLTGLRIQYSPWLTEEIENKLIPFETNLRDVSFGKQIIQQHLPASDASIFINKMGAAINTLLNTSNEKEKAGSIANVIETLRDVLGIKKLAELRERSFEDAVTRITKKD